MEPQPHAPSLPSFASLTSLVSESSSTPTPLAIRFGSEAECGVTRSDDQPLIDVYVPPPPAFMNDQLIHTHRIAHSPQSAFKSNCQSINYGNQTLKPIPPAKPPRRSLLKRCPIEESDFSILYDQIANGSTYSTINTCNSLNRSSRAHLSSHTRSKSEHHPKFFAENVPNAMSNSDNSGLLTKAKRATVQIPIISGNDAANHKYNGQITPDYEPPSPGTAESGIRAVIQPLNLEYQRVCAKTSRDIETLTEEELFATVDTSGYVRLGFCKLSNGNNHNQVAKKSVSVSTDNDLIHSLFKRHNNHHHISVDNRTYHHYCETLKLDRTGEKDNPFAGLCRGSVNKKRSVIDGKRSLRRQRHINSDTNYSTIKRNKTKKSKSMDTNGTKQGSAATIAIKMHNSIDSIDSIECKNADVSVLSSSPFDENSEWAEIASIMASFGSDIATDLNHSFSVRSLKDVKDPSVAEWLTTIGLAEYENLLIVNGFDNITFMGSNVMDDSALLEIGVTNAFDREKMLTEAKAIPKLKCLTKSDTTTTSLVEWLRSLKLNEYLNSFIANGYEDMFRIRNLWDVELNTVLEINKLGHRKRILASLHDRHKLMDDLVFDDFDFDQLNLNISELKAISDKLCSSDVPNNNNNNDENDTTIARKSLTSSQSSLSNKTLPAFEPQPSPEPLQRSLCDQWRHTNMKLINESCKYNAQYLGSTLVKELHSMDSAKASIEKLKQSTKHIMKIPNIILSISHTGVKFIDAQTNQLVCEHEIRNIHCICQDSEDLNHLAYITKETETNNHYCHVFSAQNMEISTEIILTLGQAFEIAYQMELESNGKTIPKNTMQTTIITSKNSSNNNSSSSIYNKMIDTQRNIDNVTTNNDNNEENMKQIDRHIASINIAVNSDEQYSTETNNKVLEVTEPMTVSESKCSPTPSPTQSPSPSLPVRTTSIMKPLVSNKPSIPTAFSSKIVTPRPTLSPKPTTIPKPVARAKPIPPFKPKILAKPGTTK